MNMNEWLASAASKHKAFPILSYPGAVMLGVPVGDMVRNGELQAKCMKAIAGRYDMLASVSLMDLSVEAEAFGSPVRFSGDEVPTVTGAIIGEGDSPDKLPVPEVGAARTGEYIRAIGLAKDLITHIPVFAGSIGPFSLGGRLMDMSEIMVLCYTEPELVHAVLEKAADFLIRYNTALRDAGADGLVMAEPAAGLLSPALIEEFSTPYVNQIIRAVETDEFAVVYHNCGNTIPLIESILKTGARAFHFGNAVELSQMLELMPPDRLVMGNVDPAGQLRSGTPESVKNETLRVLESCSKYDNFIISSGCDVPPLAPAENIEAFFATVEAFYR